MGGGVLRTAAKVASTGSFRSALVGEASRRTAWQPRTSFAPAVEPGLSVPSLSSGSPLNETPAVAVVARWPEWEFDEGELGGDKERSLESVDVDSRLVFGPAPTIEEAKEATTDLKDALEKVYFTHGGGQATASGERGAVSAVPKHVARMFSLLEGSSEAQEVVVSLAADKNVWEAVMKNEKVQEFCKNPSPAVTQIYRDPAEDSAAESKLNFSPVSEEEKTSEGSYVKNLLNNIKVKISQAMSNISDFVQDIFGISSPLGENATSSSDSDHKYTNVGLGASFMALAVATILVVLLKRG